MTLTKLKSALSTVRETLQAVRELPDVLIKRIEKQAAEMESLRVYTVQLIKERDAANGEWDSLARERNELRAKLTRYEAAETWHQVTAGEGKLPPEGVDVICRYESNSQTFFSKGPPMYNDKYQWRFASSKDVPQ